MKAWPKVALGDVAYACHSSLQARLNQCRYKAVDIVIASFRDFATRTPTYDLKTAWA